MWGGDPPGMVKRRRTKLLIAGLVLLTAGVVALAVSIVRLVDAIRIPDDEIVGRSVVGGAPIEFERTGDLPDQFTIYLDTSITDSDSLDRLVDATTCTITLPDGSTLRRDGNDLTTSVNLNGTANVGSFRTETGTVAVSCRSSRAEGTSLIVVEGGPRLELSAIGLLLGGIAAAIVGFILTLIGAIKRWVPATPSDTIS